MLEINGWQRFAHPLFLDQIEKLATAVAAQVVQACCIENGLVDISDPSLKARIAELNAIREQARGDADRAAGRINQIAPEITTEKIREFALAAR